VQRLTIATLIFLAIAACRIPSSMADEVQLANGDLISGEIIKIEGETIVLKTSYAEKVQVNWKKVVCLAAEKELTFVLKTEELLVGRASCPSIGTIRLEGEKIGEPAEFALSELEKIEPYPPAPAVNYRALVSAGGSINRGNTDTSTFNSSAGFQVRSKRHRVTLEGRFNIGESDGNENERNWLASGKYDFFVTNKVYTYLQTLFEYDKFQDLNLRSTAGPGLGYQFFDTERTKLFAELGPSYFREDYDEGVDNEYLSGRWAAGLKYDLLPEKIKFFHRNEGYYDLTSDKGVYIRTEQGIRLTLVRNFFLNFQANYQYRSEPPAGIKKSDTSLILGLGYELNF
jgi:putative salt-induced outer membrane protein YdiY